MKYEVPFYSQKWDLSKWQQLGFESFADAKYWEESSCGILCLKMAVDYFLLTNGKNISPAITEYIKKGMLIGAYTHAFGWSHDGLVRLAKEFGFMAESKKLNPAELTNTLEEGRLVIISIKTAFENNKTLKEKLMFWKKFGGHLALVIGFEEENGKTKGFYLNHTSIREDYNWQGQFVPINKFQVGYTGRAIIIKNNK